ncbi:MAG TPA: hypothetical protein PK542_06400 [Treponemataceae bacterium]|nr:hypothetical protein [Treponemataceae bacterium]HPS44099.1 hypothetical protein [Treponemataceae bacterium]
MKNTKMLIVLSAVCAIAVLATACKAKETAAAAAPVAAAPAINLAAVVDPATFTTAYDTVIAQYSDAATTADKKAELVTVATGLDAAAETIKGTLKDQALTDFTASADSYKAKFAALVTPAPATTDTTAAK